MMDGMKQSAAPDSAAGRRDHQQRHYHHEFLLTMIVMSMVLLMVSWFTVSVTATSVARQAFRLPKSGGATLGISSTVICRITNNGTVICHGLAELRQIPPVSEATGWRSVAAGTGFVCAVSLSSTVQCWGSRPAIPPAGVLFASVSTWRDRVCGITLAGGIMCWGDETVIPTPPQVDNAVAIDISATLACALLDDGSLTCWGNEPMDPPPVINDGVALRCSYRTCCVMRVPSRSLTCWGAYQTSTQYRPKPPDGGNIRAFGVHQHGICVIFRNSTVACNNGVLTSWVPPISNSNATDLVCGASTCCEIFAYQPSDDDDEVHPDNIRCWGNQQYRNMPPKATPQIALSTGPNGVIWSIDHEYRVASVGMPSLMVVPELWQAPPSYARSISSSSMTACALALNYTVKCWGMVDVGPLTSPPQDFPLVKSLCIGVSFGCGLTFNNTIACWNTSKYEYTIPDGDQWAQIACAEHYACALRNNGSFVCWGHVGLYTPIPPNHLYSQIAVGYSHACGILAQDDVAGRYRGDVECWGSPFTGQSGPVNLTTIHRGPYTQVSAGTFITCALVAATHEPVCQYDTTWYTWDVVVSARYRVLAANTGVCGITKIGSGVICSAPAPARGMSLMRTLGIFNRVQVGHADADEDYDDDGEHSDMLHDGNASTETRWSPRQVITTCGVSGYDHPLCGLYPITSCATLAYAMSRNTLAQGFVTYLLYPSMMYNVSTTGGIVITFPGVTVESGSLTAMVNLNCGYDTCMTAASYDASFVRLRWITGVPALIVRSSMRLITVRQCEFINNRDGSQRMGGGVTVSFGGIVYIRDSIFMGARVQGDGGGIFASFGSVYVDDTVFIDMQSNGNGGAIYTYSSTLRVRGLVVIRSRAIVGGAISCERGRLSMIESTFDNCRAVTMGGAIHVKSLSRLGTSSWLRSSEIANCSAAQGGGVFVDNSAVLFSNMIFDHNIAHGRPDAMGGAIVSFDSGITIDTVIFDLNQHRRGLATAPLIRGGGTIACLSESYWESTYIHVNNSMFTNSESDSEGGALYFHECAMMIDDSIFAWNNAAQLGGVAMLEDSWGEVNRTTFLENSAVDGGVFAALDTPAQIQFCVFTGNTAQHGGACVFAQEQHPVIRNSTFKGNSAAYGNDEDVSTPPSRLKLVAPQMNSNQTSGEPIWPLVRIAIVDDFDQVVVSENKLVGDASVALPAILGGTLNVEASGGYFYFNTSGSELVLIGMGGQSYIIMVTALVEQLRGPLVSLLEKIYVHIRLCEPGEFQSVDRCIQCAPGFYSSTYNTTTCERCPAGKYAEVSMGASSCRDCPLGSAANSDGRFGADGCISCDPGFYASSTGSTICSACEPGRYSYKNGTYGSSQCYECAAGRYQPASGQSFCRDAPVGQFVPDVAATQPIPCPKFTRQGNTGKTRCEDCAMGSFTDGTGAIECTTCGSGEYMTRNSGGGILSRNVTCRQCPKGGHCPGLGIISATDGYFLSVQEHGEIKSFPCDHEGQCIGGTDCLTNNGTQILTIDSVTVTCCGPNRYSGSGNPLCGLCLPGHSEWGGKCVACSEPNVPILLLYIFAAFIFMVAFHAVSQSTRADTRLFFYFVQMMLLFIGSEPWINWLTIFNLNPLSSTGTCVTPIKPINQLLLGVVVPLALVFTLASLALMDLLSWWCARRQLRAEANGQAGRFSAIYRAIASGRIKFFKTPYIRSAAALFAFGYNSMSQSVFRYFNCISIKPDVLRVVASVPAVNCDEDDYRSYSVFFWILLSVVLIATPIGLLIGLCVSNKRRLLSDPKHISRYGVLFETYNARCYYWEFILFLRRSVLVGLSVLLYSNRTQMLAWITFANVIILFLHVWQWPYKKPIDNYVETILLTTLSLLSAILASFSTVTQTFEVYQKVIVSMLSVLPSCCLMLLIIYNRRVAIMQKLYFICGCLCRARADAFERQYGKAAAANDAISMTSPANHHYGGDYTSITSRRTISTISNASQQPLIIACEDECDGGIAVVECLDCDADHRRCHACDHTYHRGSRRYHKRIAIHDGDETTRAISSANAAVLEVRRHSAANAHLAPMLSHLHHRSVNGGGGHHRTGSNASSSHAVMNDSKRQGPFTTPLLGATSSRINHSGTPPSLIIDEDSFPSITTTTTTTNIESPRLHPAPTPAPAPVTASPVMTSSTTIGGHRARTISIASMGSIQDL